MGSNMSANTMIMTTSGASTARVALLSLIVLLASCSHTVQSFVLPTSPPHRSSSFLVVPKATVYYGDNTGDDSYFHEQDMEAYNNMFAHDATSNIPLQFQKFFHDQAGLLARLAAEYSPLQVDLQNIDHVDVVQLDEHHMDVEAVVCQDDGCVSLMVPLKFKHDCMNENFREECVLDNMQELDHEGAERLQQQMEASTTSTTTADSDSWLEPGLLQQSIYEEPVQMELPDWWIPPLYSYTEECNDLILLLNQDDFASDILQLGRSALQQEGYLVDNYNELFQKARVLAIGPAGIHLRLFQEESSLQVSYQFAQSCHDMGESLRNAIVQAITVAVNTNHDNC